MPDAKLTPADPREIVDSIAFALLFEGRKRGHGAERLMADTIAERLVCHLERAGSVITKRPPLDGRWTVARGF